MSGISTAIGSERLSRVSGYKLNKGYFGNATPYLPQQIVILAEANTANQSTIVNTPFQITNASQAGVTFGYGSPVHAIARILFPVSGDGVGGIPVIVMAQSAANGATSTVIVWTITGTATASATHKIVINGRDSLDFSSYSVNIVAGDTPTVIALKYSNAINAVLGSPVVASVVAGVLTLTSKWTGLTSAGITAVIGTNGVAAGVTYALTSTTAGTGTPDIAAALNQFEDNWYTTVINSYGTASLTALEAYNGVPNPTPTGRYSASTFKPFMAFFGSTISVTADLIAITNAAARVDQLTNVLCPAPGSAGLPMEAAANMVTLFARISQDTPHLTVAGLSYPDMPVPASNTIGEMAVYNNRDLLKKNGCSTVTLVNGAYQVQDLVTTYHTVGETPLLFSEARYLNLDWNIKDGISILEVIHVKDHALALDNQVVDVVRVIKPKEWKAVLFDFMDYLASVALIKDPQFSKDSLRVEIDSINPNRINTVFNYKRTGTAEIASVDVAVGF